MDFKKEIEKLLLLLKNKNIDRAKIEADLDYSENYVDQTLAKGGNNRFYRNLKKYYEGILQKETQDVSRENIANDNNQNYVAQRRTQKNQSDPFLVPFVDIPAQAGYTKAYDHIDYIQTLKKFPILPDVDPHGAIWRYFQVEGHSMENIHAKPGEDEGYKHKDVLLASQVPKEDWNQFANLYTYVIVTDTNLWIKDVDRITGQNKNVWILLSINPDYDPEVIHVEDVRQLWVVRRLVKRPVKKLRMYDMTAIKKHLKDKI